MTDFMTAPLHDILREVAEDGRVDDDEIRAIQARLLDDGEITQDEAEFLFNLNDYIGENELNTTDYPEFFLEAIASFLLNDPLSPGRLDDDEWFWLKAMIAEDMELSDLEAQLLVEIAERATSLPPDFDDFAHNFEDFEYEDELAQNTFLYARIQAVIQNKIRQE